LDENRTLIKDKTNLKYINECKYILQTDFCEIEFNLKFTS